MLIGIRKGAIQPTHGSRFVDLHEDRSKKPIDIAELTHIEVPKENVQEVSGLLRRAGYALPIISLEVGDRVRFR